MLSFFYRVYYSEARPLIQVYFAGKKMNIQSRQTVTDQQGNIQTDKAKRQSILEIRQRTEQTETYQQGDRQTKQTDRADRQMRETEHTDNQTEEHTEQTDKEADKDTYR